ncbi:MAG: hypothetical protein PHR30_16505 [Gallionellaceae bacterium]|nr:hypothetical protein [Gallionellaceae bacterium]
MALVLLGGTGMGHGQTPSETPPAGVAPAAAPALTELQQAQAVIFRLQEALAERERTIAELRQALVEAQKQAWAATTAPAGYRFDWAQMALVPIPPPVNTPAPPKK